MFTACGLVTLDTQRYPCTSTVKGTFLDMSPLRTSNLIVFDSLICQQYFKCFLTPIKRLIQESNGQVIPVKYSFHSNKERYWGSIASLILIFMYPLNLFFHSIYNMRSIPKDGGVHGSLLNTFKITTVHKKVSCPYLFG